MFRIATIIAMLFVMLAPHQNAEAAERKLLMAGFKDIVIENDIAVELVTGKSPRALVIGEKRELSRVLLERRGDVLVVKLRSKLANDRRFSKQPLKLMLQNYDLENVTITGNGRLDTTSISTHTEARILIHGSGELHVGSLLADRLVATVIGNGSITFGDGKVRKGLIEIQGGAIVDAGDVGFNDLDVTHEGNGETKAIAKNAVNISNNGRGRISITGTANCFIKQAGSAVIDCPKYAN